MDLKLRKFLHDLHRFKTNRQDLEKERQRISRISLLCGEVVEVVDNAAVLVHFHAGTLNNPVKSGTLVNHVLLSLKRDALDRDEVVVDELRLVLYCRRHYTPGLLLGKPIHWKDYEIGLVDLMSIPRATALLGADYLRKTPWRLGKEDVAWCRDESVLHEVKLSREFRILLGIQRGPVDRTRAPQASHLMIWTTHPMPRQSILADR